MYSTPLIYNIISVTYKQHEKNRPKHHPDTMRLYLYIKE